jgi:short-subunit dehydrogenase
MDLGLKNKIAVITGGSVGIGLAIAEGLAAEGVHLAICARQEDRLLEVAGNISGTYGVRVLGVNADISKAEDITHFAKTIEDEFGAIDFLINNAGTGSEEKIMNSRAFNAKERWWCYPSQRFNLRHTAVRIRANLQYYQSSTGDVLQVPGK